MCGGGGGDGGAGQRAADAEVAKIKAERELEKIKADQKMLAEKQALAAKEASDSLRQRQLLGSMLPDEEETDPLTGLKKKKAEATTVKPVLLGS